LNLAYLEGDMIAFEVGGNLSECIHGIYDAGVAVQDLEK
jgi:hypothetical protein